LIHSKKYPGILRSIFVLGCILIQSCQLKDSFNGASQTDEIAAIIKDSSFFFEDNPFTAEKAELGRYFFYDRRMSSNQTKSCASCHDPSFSFTDGYRRSIGALGDLHQRNAPPLINLVYNKYLTAADSTLHFPEQQVNNPMFHEHPVELGWKGNERKIIERLRKDGLYEKKMKKLFPNNPDPFTIEHIQYCIASFVKTILSFNSPYDKYSASNRSYPLSESQKKGMTLFFSEKLACKNCHGGINFSTPLMKNDSGETIHYFNTGLYNLEGKGLYPLDDQGLFEQTKNPADMGRFRVPTLRNLAFTSPYFHDGSSATLEEVIDMYENGGRNTKTGPHTGDGSKNPFKSPLIRGFRINSEERKDLISFLMSLTDSSICNNPKYANPFKNDETEK
jgi:cytochrome c peroxidase